MEWVIEWMESHPGTASWAQAIGTVVALAIAVVVPLHQNRTMRKQAAVHLHSQAIQLFDSLGAMANYAGQMLHLIHDEFDNDADVYDLVLQTRIPDSLASMGIELDRYPIHQLPDHDSVVTALDIKASFSNAAANVNDAFKALRNGDFPSYTAQVGQFRMEYLNYCEIVESFSKQADSYRMRIEAV